MDVSARSWAGSGLLDSTVWNSDIPAQKTPPKCQTNPQITTNRYSSKPPDFLLGNALQVPQKPLLLHGDGIHCRHIQLVLADPIPDLVEKIQRQEWTPESLSVASSYSLRSNTTTTRSIGGATPCRTPEWTVRESQLHHFPRMAILVLVLVSFHSQ
jgi:hypothetical protein